MSNPSTTKRSPAAPAATLTSLLVLTVGIGLGACSPKKDVTPPDETGPTACTEEAKVCEDGSSDGREGPDCEFAACPEDAEAESDELDEADADAEPEADAEAEAAPADAE